MAAFLQILFLSFVFLLCHSNLCVNAGTITIVTPKQNLTKTESASALPAAGAPRLEASAGRALPGNIPDDLSVFSNGRKAILNVLQCLFQKEDRAQCFFDRAQRALDEQRSKLLAQADAEVDRYYSLKTGGRAKSEDKPTSVSHSVTQIITELTDMLSDSFGTFFNNKEDTTGTKDVNTITDELDDDEEEDEDIDTNAASEDGSTGVAERTSKAVSHGKKGSGPDLSQLVPKIKVKKQRRVKLIHKLIGLLKLYIAATAIRMKVEFLLKLLSAHLQIKFFLIALVGLLINLYKFFIELKKHHHESKIWYHEDAHHHYEPDTSHGWKENNGWGVWRRSFNHNHLAPQSVDTVHKIVYAGQIPVQKKI
ncbi:uncharacterized protein LOC123301053 [Chrysoperla carnea]|uniref:uncharacterized protein LOC123301053 n=1 Tax=Chrysoperla carnea TaxID=189513 RepID=UPI001D060BD0|nr:uncharacterized protein LOC123301053 [Chrysoperla carnea]